MANTLELIEWHWNGSEFRTTYASGGTTYYAGTLTFTDFIPSEVSKNEEMAWRVSKLGLESTGGHRKYNKAKWRKQITTSWTFSGNCTELFKTTIEFYASRWSKFQVKYNGYPTTPSNKIYGPKEDIFANINSEPGSAPSQANPFPLSSYIGNAQNYEPLWVIIQSVEFTMGSKPDWYRYTIKLSTVDTRYVGA